MYQSETVHLFRGFQNVNADIKECIEWKALK